MLPPELSNSLAPYRRHAVMAGLLRGAAVLFPAVGLGCVLAVWAPSTGLLVPAIMVLGGLGALGVVATSVWFRARAPLRLASQVEQLLPELGDGVRAAVGLSQDGGHAGMSVALTHALVRDVSSRLRSDGLRQRHWRALVRRLRPVLALAAVPAAVARDRLMTGLARAWTWPKAGAVGRGAALPPLWSDVTLTLRYPAYTRRPPATLEGVSGDFTAPKGTEVVLRARADRAVKAARLVFSSGDAVLGVTPPRGLEGTFVVTQGGRYRLALKDVDGDEVVEEEGHTLTLEPDQPPGVELVEPGADSTVQSNEKLALAWRSRDDFGLGETTLLVRNLRKGGEPLRKPLGSPKDEPKESTGRVTLDVASLDVRPGDRLVVSIEARDNDTVSGPKAGVSANRLLKVFSAAEHHEELIGKQEELLRRMVVQLADELETPLSVPSDGNTTPPEAEAERWLAQTRRGQTIAEALATLADAFAKDELAPVEVARALRNIRTDLAKYYDELSGLATEMANQVRTTSRFPEHYATRSKRLGHQVATRLELHILYMEDLIGKQRLSQAQDAAKELAATQARLRDLLEEFKKAGDEATRKKILEEMAALREQMRQVAEKLAALQKDIPQEYVNLEALQKHDLTDPMNDIDKMLAEGDVEGAAKALERMAQQTQEMLDQMNKSQDEYGGDEYAELREKLKEFASEMEEVTAAQDQLMKENKARLDRAREKARKELGEDAEAFAQKLQKAAEELQEQIKAVGPGLMDIEGEQREEAEARASDTSRALKARDFEEAQRSARSALGALEWLRSSLQDRTEGRFASPGKDSKKAREKVDNLVPKARALQEQLERLMPDPSDQLSDADRDSMRDNARRQGKLGERARQLMQDMDAIGKEVPLFSPEHKDMLEGARRDMQGAQADLGAQDLPGGTGRQRDALGKMQQLKKAMQDMAQQGGAGGGGGIPLPFADSGDGQGREGQGRAGSQEKVEIPNADQFKVPQQFRKDILDAMKEAPPNTFQGEVRQYYEELVK